MNENTFEVIQKGNVIVRHVDLSLHISNSNKKIIEDLWSEECKYKKHGLFNGEVLHFIDVKSENNNIIIDAGFTEYKNVLASRKKPELGLNIKQIGVSGIILVEENSKKSVLFSTRTDGVTEYPEHIELVPSGNIDKSILRMDGTVDYISKLKEEFFEETGMPTEYINKIKSICLVYDKNNQIFDIGCLIELNVAKNMILERFAKVNEYKNPEFIPIEDLHDFINKNKKKIVPTSLALLKCFLGN